MREHNKKLARRFANDGPSSEEHFQIRYLDLKRLVDSNDLNRFHQLALKCDLNALQQGNKPFIFNAIEKDEIELVYLLLEHEVDLNSKFLIELAVDQAELFTPIEYSTYLKRGEITNLIRLKMNGPKLDERWLKIIETFDLEQIDAFRRKFRNIEVQKEMMKRGLFKATELGSTRLIDYFLAHQVDINSLLKINNMVVSPLLHAITHKKNECVKYLIFRRADIHLVGEYGDALVTAIHYECTDDLIELLLEKGASLASRHRDWPLLNLREFCVQFNRVKSKCIIDNFVFRLIANNEYEKLKSLADNGYLNINVTNRFRKTGRDLAIERCHLNIVQLIDRIERKQRKVKTKMNYK